MTLLNILTFTMTMFLIVLLPGPGTFTITSKSLSHGFRSVFFIVLGMVIADVVFLMIAIFGLNSIASLLGDMFVIIKYMGALYLLYLGYSLLTSKTDMNENNSITSTSWKKSFLVGCALTFSNPKVVLFYLSVLPAFVNIQLLTALDILWLSFAITFVICTVMFGYAYIANKARNIFQSKHAKKNMNRVAGGVMICAGTTLFLKD